MTTYSLLSAVAALAAVLLLVLLAGRLLRMTRFARPGSDAGARLRIEEHLALDPRRRLVLVRCDGRSVLLLTGPQDRIVGWLPERSA